MAQYFSEPTTVIGGYNMQWDKSLQVKMLVESAKLQGIEVTPDYFLQIMDKVYLTGSEAVAVTDD